MNRAFRISESRSSFFRRFRVRGKPLRNMTKKTLKPIEQGLRVFIPKQL